MQLTTYITTFAFVSLFAVSAAIAQSSGGSTGSSGSFGTSGSIGSTSGTLTNPSDNGSSTLGANANTGVDATTASNIVPFDSSRDSASNGALQGRILNINRDGHTVTIRDDGGKVSTFSFHDEQKLDQLSEGDNVQIFSQTM